jgi:hypothetical protein
MELAGVAPTEVSVRVRAGESLTVAAPQLPPPDVRPPLDEPGEAAIPETPAVRPEASP